MKCSLGISNFLEEISSLSHSFFFPSLCIDHWGRLSYLCLLLFGTLHSNGFIFPFLLCFLLWVKVYWIEFQICRMKFWRSVSQPCKCTQCHSPVHVKKKYTEKEVPVWSQRQALEQCIHKLKEYPEPPEIRDKEWSLFQSLWREQNPADTWNLDFCNL